MSKRKTSRCGNAPTRVTIADDEPYVYDPLRVAGGILSGEITDPEVVRIAAYLVAAPHRGDPAVGPMAPDETIAALHELRDAGLVGVGPNGTAYLGEPEFGPLGTVVGCRQLVGRAPGEIAELVRACELGDTSIAFRLRPLLTELRRVGTESPVSPFLPRDVPVSS